MVVKLKPSATGAGVVAPCPQQYAALLVVTPHVRKYPALTAAQVSPPATGAEGLELVVVVPSPSSPVPLNPQQCAAPPVITPHA
jgi:hypothetical protein